MRIRLAVVIPLALLISATAFAQRERQIQAPAENTQSTQYGRQFFMQLKTVFGRFRDADLRRAFDAAHPIQCSELVNDPGLWRTVAFFNEKRELGDWYRSSLEEVKSDLAAYTFKGVCRSEQGSLQLTTKFPVTESIDAYNHGRIPFDEIDVNVNAPVRASFDEQSQAYTFDLPYLFLISSSVNDNVYTLDPPRLDGRDQYARDVVNHWDCKSVTAEAVTYQFLICRTTTAPRDPRVRNQQRAAFGATAYFILSDGKEASSSVKFTFNDANDKTQTIEDVSRANALGNADSLDARGVGAWMAPDADERIVDIVRDEFRIRFSASAWAGNLTTAVVLSGQRLSNLKSSQAGANTDLCIWFPDAGSLNALVSPDPEASVAYSATAHDREGQSSTTIVFDMKTHSGAHLASLQCVFPRQTSAASIPFEHWKSIVGSYLSLEVR